MLYQQMTGQSAEQVRSNYRNPLRDYKLGMGGINSVLALQASTGIDALGQAKSVESLRAASGYGYSTDQINQMTRGLASAESANRMFMMMGTGLYGIGGQQRSTMDVVKDTVKRLGLTNESALKGAMAPGSMTRERLRQSGLPEDMQDLVLQYARQNVAYSKKGGRGMYDPGSKADRKVAGVEGTYANQFEETERTKVNREEQMYGRQADNYAKMEEQMQKLTRAFAKLEDVLSPLIGAKIANRGFGQIAGGVLKAAALPLAFVPGVGPALGAAAAIGGTLLGDPTGEPGNGAKAVTSSGSAAASSVNKTGDGGNIARSQGQLQRLHPRMRERIERMMKDNPRLYIGGGVRSTEQQKQLFMSRYQPTAEKTDVFWKGQYWKRVRGAAAAPPGMSMHEIGLAVDFAPSSEFNWVKENAAKYGLRSFYDVNDEPWHVQPAELPGSRMKYEQAGAPWGHNGVVSEPTDMKAIVAGIEKMDHQSISSLGGAGGRGVNIAIQNYSGMSMNEQIKAMSLEMGGAGGAVSGNVSASSYGGSPSPGSGSSGSSQSGGSSVLTGSEVASLLYKAGFRGRRLVEAVAIAYRESKFNAKALNRNPSELSYGLMQINMKKEYEAKRLKDFGIKSKEDLWDPLTNVRAAYKLSGNGNNWYHWGQYKGQSGLQDTDLPAATRHVKKAGYQTTGDPTIDMAPRATMSGGVTIQGGGGNTYQVTISPTIHLQGGNNYNADVQRMARDVARLLDREVRLNLLRTT